MRPAPYGAFKRFCLWQKPCRRANSLRPRILICQGPQKSLLFWARAPTARAGVAGAGAVGVNGDCFHSFLLGRGWFCTIFAGKRKGSALRGGKGRCAFLNDQKGTKESPGNGSDERLRAAGAHSHLFPGPLFTGAGPFGFMYVPGGQNQDLFPSYSRPTGACFHPNLKPLVS